MADTLESVLGSASSGLSAQSVRMNTIASNLANAGSVGSSEETTYHKKFPIFSEITQQMAGLDSNQPSGGVRVSSIEHSKKPLESRYEPDNPTADKNGYVFVTDVNPIEEMTNMIDSSKAYEANVEVMNTTKTLIAKSIDVLNAK